MVLQYFHFHHVQLQRQQLLLKLWSNTYAVSAYWHLCSIYLLTQSPKPNQVWTVDIVTRKNMDTIIAIVWKQIPTWLT